jgi:hypothetical protein
LRPSFVSIFENKPIANPFREFECMRCRG